jgi:hypothetical protein
MTRYCFKACICGLGFLVTVESAIPPHECAAGVPRCDFAIKQDNPHGPENDPRPMRLFVQEFFATTSSATHMGTTSSRIAGYPRKT